MKPYTSEVVVELPRERVVELFDSSENLYKWQTGLQSFEHVSGEPGQPGAVSLLVFQNGRHRIELTETITANNLPDELSGNYSWKGGSNTLVSRFIELGPNRTKWESTCSYHFTSLFLRFMGFIAPGMFRKQNQMFMDNFKAFCEEGKDVREAI